MRFYIVLFIFLISCKSKTEIIDKFPDGKPKKIIEHIGKNKFYEKKYYENGVLEEIKYFENDKQEGEQVNYRKDGTKIGYSIYKNGIRNGLSQEIYQNGKIAFEGTTVNGEFEGLSKWYFENGEMQSLQYRHLSKDSGWGYEFNLKGDTIRRTYDKSENDTTQYFNGRGKKISVGEWENIGNK